MECSSGPDPRWCRGASCERKRNAGGGFDGPAAQPSVVNTAGQRPATPPKTEPKRGEEKGSLTTIAVQARRWKEAAPDRPSPAQKGTFAVPALLSYYRSCLAAEDRND